MLISVTLPATKKLTGHTDWRVPGVHLPLAGGRAALADELPDHVHRVRPPDLEHDLGIPDRRLRIDHVSLRGWGHDLVVADKVDFEGVCDPALEIGREALRRELVLRLFHENWQSVLRRVAFWVDVRDETAAEVEGWRGDCEKMEVDFKVLPQIHNLKPM